jgi:hypothetical protein
MVPKVAHGTERVKCQLLTHNLKAGLAGIYGLIGHYLPTYLVGSYCRRDAAICGKA